MLSILDLKVDGSDDILISGDDFALESSIAISSFRCGERRCQARADDFIMTPEISAGIESVIQSYITDFTISEIEEKVRTSLQYHQLFSHTDFKVYINADPNDQHKLKVLIAFNMRTLTGRDSEYNFSIVVNTENQRAFR
jgi:hypothetical protein